MSCATALFDRNHQCFLHSCSGRWIVIHQMSSSVGSIGVYLFKTSATLHCNTPWILVSLKFLDPCLQTLTNAKW